MITYWVSVPYLTWWVPLNTQVLFSVAHRVQASEASTARRAPPPPSPPPLPQPDSANSREHHRHRLAKTVRRHGMAAALALGLEQIVMASPSLVPEIGP
ncbi:hypothetical protein D9M70_498370 [compost metagenome]